MAVAKLSLANPQRLHRGAQVNGEQFPTLTALVFNISNKDYRTSKVLSYSRIYNYLYIHINALLEAYDVKCMVIIIP